MLPYSKLGSILTNLSVCMFVFFDKFLSGGPMMVLYWTKICSCVTMEVIVVLDGMSVYLCVMIFKAME
jgi:hypothetical protein